jgi:hypothetical protein
MRKVVLFISTGRCGTQWITKTFSEVYDDLAIVTHEPIGPNYRPKEFLRAYERMEELRTYPEIDKHLDWVRLIGKNKMYIETGWPCLSAIPLFHEMFGKNLKLVHLVRHPIFTALSLVIHNFYRPEIRYDKWTKYAQLDPSGPGIVQQTYRERWSSMTPYEKCLFSWTEINLYALELRERFAEVPFFQIKFEDLMRVESGALQELTTFLGLPFREALVMSLETRVDQHHLRRTELDIDWRQVFEHPQTVALAHKLGYTFDGIEDEALQSRYRMPPEKVLWWELGYGYFDSFELPTARAYFKRAIMHSPKSWSNYAYYLATWLPVPVLKALRQIKRWSSRRIRGSIIERRGA